MAEWMRPTAEQRAQWAAWVASRPEPVRTIAGKLNPWELYRLKDTGQRVTLQAFSEDGTVRVQVSGQYNLIVYGRDVFGIHPSDLEPCDLPGAEETLGELLTQDEALAITDQYRGQPERIHAAMQAKVMEKLFHP